MKIISFILLLFSLSLSQITSQRPRASTSYNITNNPDGTTIVLSGTKLKLANPFLTSQTFSPTGSDSTILIISSGGVQIKRSQPGPGNSPGTPVFFIRREMGTTELRSGAHYQAYSKNDSTGRRGMGIGPVFFASGPSGVQQQLGQIGFAWRENPTVLSMKSQMYIIGSNSSGSAQNTLYRITADGIYPLDSFVSNDVYTGADIKRDLGSTQFQWNKVYADTVKAIEDYDGNNTIGVEDLKTNALSFEKTISPTSNVLEAISGTYNSDRTGYTCTVSGATYFNIPIPSRITNHVTHIDSIQINVQGSNVSDRLDYQIVDYQDGVGLLRISDFDASLGSTVKRLSFITNYTVVPDNPTTLKLSFTVAGTSIEVFSIRYFYH